MIENTILKILKQDAVLAELTGGRIYPGAVQAETLPCVVMRAGEPVSPNGEPWAYTQNVSFAIYAPTIKQAQDIRNRFYELLQQYDKFFYADLQNAGIIIREAHAAVSAENHFPLETEQAKAKIVSFDFYYTK